MPDFAGVVKKGLRADLVIKGKAADRAGMENGDIITAINGNEVGDIYDYMERMSDFKPGETITVEILRNGQQKVLMVQL
jgi:S1-C subfamily serine protease